jgi:Putative Ig domain/REJ domain/PKD domain
MKTSLKPITRIQNWRLAAVTIGSALAMSFATTAFAANPPNINSGNATGTVNVAFSYQMTANQAIPNNGWHATGLPPGLNPPNATGLISGTPTAVGTYTVHLSVTNANGTGTKDVTFTMNSGPTAIATISPSAVYMGDIVTLDASASHTNPPGGTLIYTWQQIAPSTLTISLSPDNKSVMATFAAPAPPVGANSQAVTFQVKVTDNSVSGGAKNTMSNPVTTTVYTLPVANAGPDQNVDQGTTVMLNGSGSTGVNLTYAWTAPPGITFTDTGTQNSSLPNPTFTAPPFTPPNGVSYTFTLMVTEQRPNLLPKQSAPDTVVIMVKQPPIALTNLSNDINTASRISEGNVGESSCSYTTPVTLYGFGVDPDNDTFTYAWTQVHDTGGAPLQQGDTAVQLSDTSSQTPNFTAPNVPNGQQQIDLVFQLIVNDGTINSAPAYVTVHVLNTNDPPIAALTVNGQMPDMNNAVNGVPASTQVTLDGSTSSDPNNNIQSYTWTQLNPDPAYPVTDLTTNPASPLATFTAPAVSFQQHSITLTFQLTVSDGDCSDSKQVSIMVVNNNRPPVADAGVTQTVPEASTAVLDGSGSYDPDSDPITFQWTQVHDTTGAPLEPSDPVISSLTPVTPDSKQVSFVAPTFGGLGGSVTFQLIVTDSHGASSTPSYVVVNVYPNRPPVPNAGPNQTVNEHSTVALSGSATDADNNPLTYTWDQVHDTSGAPPLPTDLQVTVTYQDPNDPSNANASFVAPEVPCGGGTVVMRLTVNDGYVDAFAYVTITINNVNNNPTANAGAPQNVSEGAMVALNGSNSSDLDPGETQTLTFLWTQTGGTGVVLSDPTAASPTFTAPQIGGGDPNAFVDLAFHLVVSDGCGGSGASDSTVHVANIPHAPTASAAGPATANEGGVIVVLDGSASSDPDNDPLTYVWTQVDGPSVTLNNATSAMASFTTPWVSANTTFKFQLTVSDPYGGSSSAYVTVTVLNINTPPTLVNPRADVPVLWPPDHRMVPVHILGVVDPDQPPYNATITINSVTQDEPTNGLGDGDTPVDAIITHNPVNDDTLLLRAERSGRGNGRVYHVHFTASDPEGSVSGTVTVAVPHDKKTDVAGDGGSLYDSTH